MTAGPLSVLYDLFKPVRFVLSKLVARVAIWTTPAAPVAASPDGKTGQPATEPPSDAPTDTESDSDSDTPKLLRVSDFLLLLEEGHKEGAVQQTELKLIKNVFELDDTTVAEVFTPLPQVQTLTERTTVRSALNMMRSQKHSRIPVTATAGQPARRKVVGILYSKDLLRARLEPEQLGQTVESLMRKPLFVEPWHRSAPNSLSSASSHQAAEDPHGRSPGGLRRSPRHRHHERRARHALRGRPARTPRVRWRLRGAR